MNSEQAMAQVAEKYRGEGYRVVTRPEAKDLPPFAADRGVDLVAYRNGENVLVQVKVTREDLQKDPQIVQTAEIVGRQPGWRLDLVVLNPDGTAYRVSADASEPPAEKILQELARAEAISKGGELSAAFVISWAALEAAMRQAARRGGLQGSNPAPSFLLRALYSDGWLHREEFDRLSDALKLRNALVHGMSVPALDPALPRYLAGVTRRLLSPDGRA